jgi:hypothetical protein
LMQADPRHEQRIAQIRSRQNEHCRRVQTA